MTTANSVFEPIEFPLMTAGDVCATLKEAGVVCEVDRQRVYYWIGGEKYEITPRRWVSRLLTEYAIYNFEDFKHLVYPQTELDHDNDYDGAGGDDDNR